MTNEYNNNEPMDFETMMEQRIQANFATTESGLNVSNERLNEMNKRLPSWSLEPPYSFLK